MDQYLEFITNHYLLAFAFVVVSFLLIQDLLENTFNKAKTISPLLAVTRMNSHDVLIVDIREVNEFIKGHIDGAKNIPLGKLDEQLGSLNTYKNSELLLVCQTGTRTTSATKILGKAGFEKMLVLKGGMQSWEDNKLPVNINHKTHK
jgi:rhodanese-related sulfurtransferase